MNPEPCDEPIGRCFLRDRHQIVTVLELNGRADAAPDPIWPSVIMSGRSEDAWPVAGGVRDREVRHRAVLRTPSMPTAYHAALAGAGVVKLP